jgi:hypothetical protein
VTELEAVAGVVRERGEEAVEGGVVTLEVLRQLPEDRTEASGLAQRLERLPEALQPGVGVGEAGGCGSGSDCP